MSSVTPLFDSIVSSVGGLTLAELLRANPDTSRRTVQRHVAGLITNGSIVAHGFGRSRPYTRGDVRPCTDTQPAKANGFPYSIPVSADSQDSIAYVDPPVRARKPVSYQRDFLDAYRPNQTWYLADSLRRQLSTTGRTSDMNAPAGTYSRAILNRLLIERWKAARGH